MKVFELPSQLATQALLINQSSMASLGNIYGPFGFNPYAYKTLSGLKKD